LLQVVNWRHNHFIPLTCFHAISNNSAVILVILSFPNEQPNPLHKKHTPCRSCVIPLKDTSLFTVQQKNWNLEIAI